MSSDMVILLAEMPASSKVPPRPGGLGGAASLAATWSVSFVSSMMVVVGERIYEMNGRLDARDVLGSSAEVGSGGRYLSSAMCVRRFLIVVVPCRHSVATLGLR